MLQQLVITGEGTITTNEKLGATVNNVGADQIAKSNEQNLTESLAGKAPNVQVTSESGRSRQQREHPDSRSEDVLRRRPAAVHRRRRAGGQLVDQHAGTVREQRGAGNGQSEPHRRHQSERRRVGHDPEGLRGGRDLRRARGTGRRDHHHEERQVRQDAVRAALVVLVRQGDRRLSAADHVRPGQQRLPRRQRRRSRLRRIFLQPQLGTAARARNGDVQSLQRNVRDRPRRRQQSLDLGW